MTVFVVHGHKYVFFNSLFYDASEYNKTMN